MSHSAGVCRLANRVAARSALHRLPDPSSCLRPVTGVRMLFSPRLLSIGTAGWSTNTPSPEKCSSKLERTWLRRLHALLDQSVPVARGS